MAQSRWAKQSLKERVVLSSNQKSSLDGRDSLACLLPQMKMVHQGYVWMSEGNPLRPSSTNMIENFGGIIEK